ncbi:MAG: LysM peptidoglycan-binding domain-containing protein [Williamsia sp.]|nr:LysM peptidoglycan-binding domain-containing protein [Williamsia sp.]
METWELCKLEKLKIKAYDPKKRSSLQGSFEAMFNPESYTVGYQNTYSRELAAVGTGGTEAKFSRSENASMSFKLILDGTGVSEYDPTISANKKKDVYKEVQHFLKMTTWMNGEKHEPNVLKLSWSKLDFECRLESVQIAYTLFDESGKPLRAELDVSFVEDIETSQRMKKANMSSPDLTHKRIVKAYDTLPLMCEEIYGSGSYYLQVARVNRLDDFRNLVPGQELFFPPLQK